MFKSPPPIAQYISGDERDCENLIFSIKAAVESYANEVTSMTLVEEECDNYMKRWKADHPIDAIFPRIVLVFGYDEGVASIYSNTIGKPQESHKGAIMGSGSGFQKNKEYMEEQLENRMQEMGKSSSRRSGEPRSEEYCKWLK